MLPLFDDATDDLLAEHLSRFHPTAILPEKTLSNESHWELQIVAFNALKTAFVFNVEHNGDAANLNKVTNYFLPFLCFLLLTNKTKTF